MREWEGDGWSGGRRGGVDDGEHGEWQGFERGRRRLSSAGVFSLTEYQIHLLYIKYFVKDWPLEPPGTPHHPVYTTTIQRHHSCVYQV